MNAFTAAPHHDVLVLLIQIALLLFTARALGEVAQRAGQPAVVGEILAGILLGPSLLSGLFPALGAWILPHSPTQGYLLEVVSLFGVMFLLLITGLETDLALIRRQARTAMGASLGGILVPFGSGFLLGQYLPTELLADPSQRLVFALFIATAMSISAIPVIAKVLMDLRLMRRDIGQTIIAAGMTDDALGWMLLSVVVGLVSGAAVTAGTVLWSVAKVVGFIAFSFTAGRWLVRRSLGFVQDRVVSSHRLLTLVVVFTFGWGALSQGLGLEAMLGAFVVGILFGQMPRLPQEVRHSVERIAIGIFAPIFFGVAGLKVDLQSLLDPRLLAIAVIVILVACFGKVVGGYAGARLLGGRDHWTALSFGVGLNARGAMEIIIATIGLSLGILTQEMFSIIVLMAITTSLMAPPALRWTLKHVRPEEQELRRLKQEELAETSLVAQVRRVLLPVRCRTQERRAILSLEAHLLGRLRARAPLAVTLLGVVDACDRDAGTEFMDRLISRFPSMEISRKLVVGRDAGEAILDEARKGYDLLILGASDTGGTEELFNPMVDYVVRLAPCPTLIVKGRLSAYRWPPKRILVPTNGSAAARQAVDVAFALASAEGARGRSGNGGGDGEATRVRILNVVLEEGRRYRVDATGSELQRDLGTARALVEELSTRGELQGIETERDVRTGADVDAVLLLVAEEAAADLIVLGTDLRVGSDRLFLGPRVGAVLKHAPCPVVVVNAS